MFKSKYCSIVMIYIRNILNYLSTNYDYYWLVLYHKYYKLLHPDLHEIFYFPDEPDAEEVTFLEKDGEITTL